MSDRTLPALLKRIREDKSREQRKYIPNWKQELPEGSEWFPGSTGKPDCLICKGIGWTRQDLPRGHPLFGKLQPCKCAS